MQIDVKGRNLTVTDDLRERVEKRFEKVAKQVSELARLEVEVSHERNPAIAESQVAEATLYLKGVTLRARETAFGEFRVVDALAECDFGAWAGLTLDAIEPDDLALWMLDPDATPHGGESLTTLLDRVRGWLDEQAELDGTAIAITHGGVVKAAVTIALDAPPSAFWRIDVSPLSITELHAHDGRWTVTRVNDRGVSPAEARA